MVVVHEMVVDGVLRGILRVLPQYPLHVVGIAPPTHCGVHTGNVVQNKGLRIQEQGGPRRAKGLGEGLIGGCHGCITAELHVLISLLSSQRYLPLTLVSY